MYAKKTGPFRVLFLASVLSGIGALYGCGGGGDGGGDGKGTVGAGNRGNGKYAENVFETSAENQADTFRNLNKIETTRAIHASGKPFVLEDSPMRTRLAPMDGQIKTYMDAHRVAGFLILKDGKIAYERYGMGNDQRSKWTNFSIAKSFLATLVGAAVQDGKIALDRRAQDYLPSLNGTFYGEATVRELLRMTSAVKWSDDTEDGGNLTPLKEAARSHRRGALLEYLATLPKGYATRGYEFNYNSGDSHVLAEIVQAATGIQLNAYLSQKVWGPAGMEDDGYWWSETPYQGIEFGGGNISATLRDHGRFGHFILTGAKAGGKSALPDDWGSYAYKAGKPLSGTNYGAVRPDDQSIGYGYHWWVIDPGKSARPADLPIFFANGIYGQYIFIDRQTNTVAVVLSAWRQPNVAFSEDETFGIIADVIDTLSA